MAVSQQSLSSLETTLRHAPCNVDHALALITLNRLADENVRPVDQQRTPAFAIREWAAKDLLNGLQML